MDQLQEAAKAVSEGRLVENPTIQRLQRSILTIGMQVPESFAQKVKRRSEIKGLIARYGMPAFWLTINPSDLRIDLISPLFNFSHPLILPTLIQYNLDITISKMSASPNDMESESL